MKPLCFVLMPFGTKAVASGAKVDFDAVYNQMIRPAVEAANMEPIRADEEQVGGWIHKPMFERLMMCDYAIADLTGSNANVFYELGIRHALRPSSTVVIFQSDTVLPFDVAPIRGLPYNYAALDAAKAALTARLNDARKAPHKDSPMFQMFSDLPKYEPDHSKTDIFRDKVHYSQSLKQELARAREQGDASLAALDGIRAKLGTLEDEEAGVIIDLLLSYRAIKAFDRMEKLYQDMTVPLQRNRMVREQRAFALNRLGRKNEAVEILTEIIKTNGPSPEVNGLLGRVYKDLYDAAEPGSFLAKGHLKKAIETYLQGFEADWRDAYPGVNVVALMEQLNPVDPRQKALLPVVRYAVERKLQMHGGDYWDQATLLELAVLERDPEAAAEHLATALPLAEAKGELFAPETTARNLGLTRKVREARGEDAAWIAELERELLATRDRMQQNAKTSA